MADRTVTSDTFLVCALMRALYGVNYFRMTLSAGLFGHFAVMRLDPYGFIKSPRSKGERVPETIRSLRGILGHKSRRSVAIVTNRHCVMARLLPAFEMLSHNVAIGAGSGVIGHV